MTRMLWWPSRPECLVKKRKGLGHKSCDGKCPAQRWRAVRCPRLAGSRLPDGPHKVANGLANKDEMSFMVEVVPSFSAGRG